MIVADDFGISDGVSQAVIELEGRVHGFSAMVLPETKKRVVEYRKKLRAPVFSNLHLTLTCHQLFHIKPWRNFSEVFKDALLKRIDLERVEKEFSEQISAFCDVFGKAPYFIDSHQHIHQLPGLRDVVVNLLKEKSLPSKIRVYDQPFLWRSPFFGESLIEQSFCMFGRRLKKTCHDQDIPTNRYLFSLPRGHGSAQKKWQLISKTYDQNQDILLAHPGFSEQPELFNGDFMPTRERDLMFLQDL